MESIHYDAVMQHVVLSIYTVLKYASGEIKKPNDVFTYEFQNLIVILMQIMEEKHRTYYSTLKEIDLITELINKAL